MKGVRGTSLTFRAVPPKLLEFGGQVTAANTLRKKEQNDKVDDLDVSG